MYIVYWIIPLHKCTIVSVFFCLYSWHILRIKFKKSSLADKIGFNWRKLDKFGENWRKLILTIEGERKGQVF